MPFLVLRCTCVSVQHKSILCTCCRCSVFLNSLCSGLRATAHCKGLDLPVFFAVRVDFKCDFQFAECHFLNLHRCEGWKQSKNASACQRFQGKMCHVSFSSLENFMHLLPSVKKKKKAHVFL